MGTDYKAIGDPSDVQNINPYTQNAWNQMSQMFPAASAGMQGIIGQMGSMTQYDPDAWMRQLISQNPTLQGFVQQSVDPFGQAATRYADVAAANAMRDIEARYAGTNLHSGDFGQAVARGVAEPYLQAAQASEALQSNMSNSLLQLAAQINAQGQQYAIQSELERLAQQGGLYGSMLNTAGAGMASLGQPEYWQPTYVEDVGPLKGALGGAVSGALTGIMSGNPWGALIGGLGGGAMGALGMGGAGAGYAASSYYGARQEQDQWNKYLELIRGMNPTTTYGG
jgi:hypothetical protein